MKSLYLICSVLIYVKSQKVLKKDHIPHVNGIKPHASLDRDKEKMVNKRDELEEIVFDEGNMLNRGDVFRRSDLVQPPNMPMDESYPNSMMFRRSDLFRNPMVPLAAFQGISPNPNELGPGDGPGEYDGPGEGPPLRPISDMGENEDDRIPGLPPAVSMMNPYFPYLRGRMNQFQRGGDNPMFFGHTSENIRSPNHLNPDEMLPFRKQLIMGKKLPYILNDRNGGAQHQIDELLDSYMYKMAQNKPNDRPSNVDTSAYLDGGNNDMNTNSPLMFPPLNQDIQEQSAAFLPPDESSSPQGEMQVGPRPIEARFFQNTPDDNMNMPNMNMNMDGEYPQSHEGSPMFPPNVPPENAPNFNMFGKSSEENAGARGMKIPKYYRPQMEPPMESMRSNANLINPIASNDNRYARPYESRKGRAWRRKMAKHLSRLALRMNVGNVFSSINSDERSYKKGLMNSMPGIRKNNVVKKYAQTQYGTRSNGHLVNTGNVGQDALENKYEMIINSLSHKHDPQLLNIHTYSDIERPDTSMYGNSLPGSERSDIPKSKPAQSRSDIPKNSQPDDTKPIKLQPRSTTPNGNTKPNKLQPQQHSTIIKNVKKG